MLNCMVYLADGRCLGVAAEEDRFALVLESNGVCFHLVSSFGPTASRHITRFVLPKYKSAIKQLLDFRNAYSGGEVYLCDELYSEPAGSHQKHFKKHQGNPILCPTSSRRNFVWVQRNNNSSGEFSPRSIETPQQIEFTCDAQFISKVQVLIHQYPDFSLEQFQAVVEETSRYIITREHSSLECLIKEDDSLLVLQNGDEFLTHRFADKPSKVYSAMSVPHMVYSSEGDDGGYEIASIVKHMFQFGTLTPNSPLPAPALPLSSRLQVLCDVVDRNANTFTAFSDHSVLIRFHDRTLLKIVPGEDQVAHLLLTNGETCLVSLSNPLGFEKYLSPCNEFLETCFLHPVERLQRESERMEIDLRIKNQLNKTKQLLRANETIMRTLW